MVKVKREKKKEERGKERKKQMNGIMWNRK